MATEKAISLCLSASALASASETVGIIRVGAQPAAASPRTKTAATKHKDNLLSMDEDIFAKDSIYTFDVIGDRGQVFF
jgi:hypothetical protein